MDNATVINTFTNDIFETKATGLSVTLPTTMFAVNYTNNVNQTSSNNVNSLTQQERVALVFNPVGIIAHIICVVGLFANSLSIAAVCSISRERTSHLKLIISLAVSDILILFTEIFCDYMFIFTNYDCFVRLTRLFLTATALCAILANLLAMALDHYFAIVYPFKYLRLMSNKRCTCIILCIWLTSVFIGLTDKIVAGSAGLHVCKYCEDSYQLWQPLIGIFFVTLITIAFVYTRLYVIVRNMGLFDKQRLMSQSHDSKALATTLIIVVTFVIGWLPHEASTIAQYIIMDHYPEILQSRDTVDTILIVHKICLVLILLNSLADPLIYGVRLQSVRKGYKTLWLKLIRQRNNFSNEVRFQNDKAYVTIQYQHVPSSTIVSDQAARNDNVST